MTGLPKRVVQTSKRSSRMLVTQYGLPHTTHSRTHATPLTAYRQFCSGLHLTRVLKHYRARQRAAPYTLCQRLRAGLNTPMADSRSTLARGFATR